MLGKILAVGIGGDEYLQLFGATLLFAQLIGAFRGEVGYRFRKGYEIGRALAEGTGSDDRFFLVLHGADLDTPLAVEFFPGAQPHDTHLTAHPVGVAPCEIEGGMYAVTMKHGGIAAPDTPHIFYRSGIEGGYHRFLRIEQADAVVLRILLGDTVGDLGERLGLGYPHTGGDAGPLQYGLADMGAVGRQVVIVEAVETQERFVYRIYFGSGRESGEDAHHPARHIAVEGIVGGEYCYIVLLYQLFELVGGFTHRDAQCLGLVGASYDAAVVIAQYYDGTPYESGIEYPFAGAVKVVAVNQRDHFRLIT